MQVYGLTKSEAGHILSMLAVGMVVGSPLCSYLSNRVFQGRRPVIVLSGVLLVCLTALLAFDTDRLSIWVLYLICLGLGVFSSAIVVIGFTTTKELFPVSIAGTSTGLVNIFPFAGGAVAQPVLGVILESQGKVDGAFTVRGYEMAFMALFVCAIIALCAGLCLKETLNRTD
jgi:sugar phosphate permease